VTDYNRAFPMAARAANWVAIAAASIALLFLALLHVVSPDQLWQGAFFRGPISSGSSKRS